MILKLILLHAHVASMAAAQADVSKRSCVKGYHVYKDIWTPPIGEELVCHREQRNAHDFNRTKCTTFSKYGMNVHDEAEVDRVLAQPDTQTDILLYEEGMALR